MDRRMSVSTFRRLDDIMANFDTFQGEIRSTTEQRREADQARIKELQTMMDRLREDLDVETKRREAMQACTGAKVQLEVDAFRVHCRERIAKEREVIGHRIAALQERCEAMAAVFDVDFRAIPREIERRGAELEARLVARMGAFDDEKQDRLMRETAILTRFADAESAVTQRFHKHRGTRETAFDQLRHKLTDHVDRTDDAVEHFNASLAARLAQLKNSMVIESTTRQHEDKAIASAMDTYIDNMQASLKIVNSDET